MNPLTTEQQTRKLVMETDKALSGFLKNPRRIGDLIDSVIRLVTFVKNAEIHEADNKQLYLFDK